MEEPKAKLKDLIQDSPIHERKLDFRTYPLKDDRLIVEGWLKDERLVPGYHWDGQPRSTGIVHWMCARLLLGGWPPSIMDAEAEMPGIPHELCPTTLESVKKIIGVSIVSGFSEKVRRRLGGINGCAHLTSLIVAMGPVALHGYWTQRSRKRMPIPHSLDEFPGFSTLLNSCKLWGKDGPLIQALQETLREKEAKKP